MLEEPSSHRLVAPAAEHADSYRALVREVVEAKEALIPFTLGFAADPFPAFLDKLAACSRGEGIPEGFVAHSTFWLVHEGVVVGVSNVRHRLTEALRRNGGNIGYSVRPSARGRRLGRELLRLTLERARELRIREAWLTCAKSNVASARTILANGGSVRLGGAHRFARRDRAALPRSGRMPFMTPAESTREKVF